VYQQLLLVLDADEACDNLLADALNLSRHLSAALHVLVLIPMRYGSVSHHHAELSVIEFTSGGSKGAYPAADLLETVRAQGEKAGVTVSSCMAGGESVTRAVVQAAHAVQCDAIVMSAHLRPSLPDLWLGSVAQRVTRKLSKPVILLAPSAPQLEGGDRMNGLGLGFL
jgi:nucleotide-binding universal stress UspA family protein